MAKRANPFVEDFVQQSKIHVGIKQFNNNEYRLHNVYEKTLELLYRGAKKPTARVAPTVVVAPSVDTPAAKKGNLKQLSIGKDGALSRLEPATVQPQCSTQMCTCGNASAETQCGYCEANLCNGCRARCTHCDGVFCSKCSLAGSEGSAVCVSCYT